MKRVSKILVALLFLALMFPLAASPAPVNENYSAGVLALKSGDSQKAVTLLSKAIEARPGEFRFYNDRGVAYRMMGDLEKAVADYSKAIELKPDYTNALNNRGVVNLQRGLYDKAVQDFSEALKYGGLESKIYTNLGAAYAAKGDHRTAIKNFDAAISLRPMDYRAFIFMAETLEKIGDKERAVKMYQLGVGLVPDAALSSRLEKKIASLEKTLLVGRQRAETSANVQAGRADQAVPEKSRSDQTAKPDAGQTRKIILAKPIPPTAPEVPKPSAPDSVEPGIETPENLEQRARTRIMGKVAPASAEILRQGMEFLEKNDSTKALIRFEDTLQLEKRKKNELGVAWSSFEIGRVYSRLGDHLKAASYLDVALKIFRKAKAQDEVILALLELAGSKAKAGHKDQAAALYSAAANLAVSVGHHGLSKPIANLAAGKPYEQPKPAVALTKQTKADQRTASVGDQTGRATAPVTGQPRPAVNNGQHLRTGQPGSVVAGGPLPETVRKPAPPPTSQERITVSQQVSRMVERKAEPERPAAASKPKPTQAKPAQVETNVAAPGGVESAQAHAASPGLQASARRSPIQETSAENRIREDLATLKKLRASNDEAHMVNVLERLANHYIRRKEYKKASYCLNASLALQHKLGLDKGRQKAFYQSGLLKEKLGDQAGAIEDLTRASVLSDGKTGPKAIKDLDARVSDLAARLKIDAPAILAGFKMLWKARAVGDDQTETEALYAIGKLYDKADKPAEALNYYERSSASMLVDKARMHQKMGSRQLAQDAYDRALEIFRKLDYSRYIGLVKKIRTPRFFSKQ
ncbi:MAG: tetratricopeptide repeat protein [Desulfomonile tiedjei]|nr:tetratricopeptide repeat protein [Desulfomonile tiedjei]